MRKMNWLMVCAVVVATAVSAGAHTSERASLSARPSRITASCAYEYSRGDSDPIAQTVAVFRSSTVGLPGFQRRTPLSPW